MQDSTKQMLKHWYTHISRVLSGTSSPLELAVPLGKQKIKQVLWSPTSINQMLLPAWFKRPTRWLAKKAEGFSKEPREFRTTAQCYGNWGRKGHLVSQLTFLSFVSRVNVQVRCQIKIKIEYVYLIFGVATFLSSVSHCYLQAECTPKMMFLMIW